MTLQKILVAAIACATLTVSAASAAPDDRDPQQHRTDRDEMGGAMRGGMPGMRPEQHWKDDRGTMHRDHDRYWQPQYRETVAQDRILPGAARTCYARFNGAPYWNQGRYVVKSFDRRGRPVFIEVNPYTGAYVGVVRF